MDKRVLLIAASILLIVLVGIGFFVVNQDSDNSESSKKAQRTDTTQITTETSTSPSTSSGEETTSTTTTPSTISVSLTTPVDGQKIDGNVIAVRTIVNGTSSGECTVTFSHDTYPDVTAKAPVTQLATYSSCQGFDIDRSKFQGPGKWTLIVKVSHNKETATSQKQTVVIT